MIIKVDKIRLHDFGLVSYKKDNKWHTAEERDLIYLKTVKDNSLVYVYVGIYVNNESFVSEAFDLEQECIDWLLEKSYIVNNAIVTGKHY